MLQPTSTNRADSEQLFLAVPPLDQASKLQSATPWPAKGQSKHLDQDRPVSIVKLANQSASTLNSRRFQETGSCRVRWGDHPASKMDPRLQAMLSKVERSSGHSSGPCPHTTLWRCWQSTKNTNLRETLSLPRSEASRVASRILPSCRQANASPPESRHHR